MATTHEELDDIVKLSFFADIGKEISAATTTDEIIHSVMNKIGEIFAPANWSLLLKDRKTGELYFKLVIGESSDTLQGKRIPKGKGIASWIVENGQAAIIEDVKKDSRFFKHFDDMSKFKTKSIIGVPLKSNKRVIGVIELINKLDDKSFTPAELKILSTIADFAAIAIEKVYYFNALKKLASIDPLTGLYNRRSLEVLLYKEIEKVKRYKHEISMLMLDIDDFKKINDRLGHVIGDKILKNIASIMKKSARKVDITARYGGDEFVIIMPHTSRQEAEMLRKRIQGYIKEHNKKQPKMNYNISIGVHSAGSDDIDDLLKQTDVSMYREKDNKEEKYIKEIEGELQGLS